MAGSTRMNARIKAVARVLVRAYGRDFDTDEIAARALKNADRILFNDAAVERVAREIYSLQTAMSINPVPWDEQIPRIHNHWKRNAQRIIAALGVDG